MPKAPAEGEGASTFTYDVFLSYCRADAKTAVKLASALENVGRPVFRIPRVGKPAVSVCRDVDSFLADQAVRQQIITTMLASRKVVLLASPSSADSAWVNWEIEQFVVERARTMAEKWRSSGKADLDAVHWKRVAARDVILVLSAGRVPWTGPNPHSWEAGDDVAISEALFALLDEPDDVRLVQVLGPWPRPLTQWLGGGVVAAGVVASVAATALGVAKETIFGRQLAATRKTRAFLGAVVVGLAIAAIFAWKQMRRADAAAIVAEQRRQEAETARDDAQASALETKRESARELAREADVLTREDGQEWSALSVALRAWHRASSLRIAADPVFGATLHAALETAELRHTVPSPSTGQIWLDPTSDLVLRAARAGGTLEIHDELGRLLISSPVSSFDVDRGSGQIAFLRDDILSWGPIGSQEERRLPAGDPWDSVTLAPGGNAAILAVGDGDVSGATALVVRGETALHSLGAGWKVPEGGIAQDGRQVVLLDARRRPYLSTGGARPRPLEGALPAVQDPDPGPEQFAFDSARGHLDWTDGTELRVWDAKTLRLLRKWSLPLPPAKSRLCLTAKGVAAITHPSGPWKALLPSAPSGPPTPPKPMIERPLPGQGCDVGGVPAYVVVNGPRASSVLFTPDLRLLVVEYTEGPTRLFDAGTGDLLAELPTRGSLAWMPEANLLVTGGASIWSLGREPQGAPSVPEHSDPQLVTTLGGVGGPVATNANGWLAVTTGKDVRVRNEAGLRGRYRIGNHGRIADLRLTPDGILVVHPDGVELVDETLNPIASAKVPGAGGDTVRWEARDDGTALGVAGGAAWLWRDRKLIAVQPTQKHAGAPSAFHLASSSDEVAVTWSGGDVSVMKFDGVETFLAPQRTHWREGWPFGGGEWLFLSDGKQLAVLARSTLGWTGLPLALEPLPRWIDEGKRGQTTVIHDLPGEPPSTPTKPGSGPAPTPGQVVEALGALFIASLLSPARPKAVVRLSDPDKPSVELAEVTEAGRAELAGFAEGRWTAKSADGRRQVGWKLNGTLEVEEIDPNPAPAATSAAIIWIGRPRVDAGPASPATPAKQPTPPLSIQVGRPTADPMDDADPVDANGELSAGVAVLRSGSAAVLWRRHGEVVVVPLTFDGIVDWACDEAQRRGLKDTECPGTVANVATSDAGVANEHADGGPSRSP
jgi:hypothetical protein